MVNTFTVTHTQLSAGRALACAWPLFRRRAGLLAAILLTMAGAWVALEVAVIAGQRLGVWWWAAAHLAFLAFFAGLEAGLLWIGLRLHDGGEPTFADAFARLALGPKLLAGQVIYLVLVAAGLALLVVPGVYLGARYALFGFCLVAPGSGEAGLLRSFQESARLTAGGGWRLAALLAALLALNVLGASLLGLGLFITFTRPHPHTHVIIPHALPTGAWCNGSTPDFGSVNLGSSPGAPA